MQKPVSKEILFEYFSGRATPLQTRMIEEWLGQPGNQDYYYQYLDEWENKYPQHAPDLEKALTAYESFMDQQSARPVIRGNDATGAVTVSVPFLGRAGLRWLAAAVSLLLVATGAFAGKEYLLYRVYSTGRGETRTLNLADCQVTLNTNSSLKVSRGWFSGSGREVWLEGEAFFDVHKTPDRKRFVVHTSVLEVEVLGTRFNVTDRRSKTRVVLQEGEVKITSSLYPKSQPVLMRPGDYVEHSPRRDRIEKKAVNTENYTAWRENKLVFESRPLREVLETVEDYYNVDIQLRDTALASKQYTGILPANDIDVIIKSLSTIYELQISREENLIILQ
jgi:ferric-dicitrate binding protein FerR (iron transport regulator)